MSSDSKALVVAEENWEISAKHGGAQASFISHQLQGSGQSSCSKHTGLEAFQVVEKQLQQQLALHCNLFLLAAQSSITGRSAMLCPDESNSMQAKCAHHHGDCHTLHYEFTFCACLTV